MKQFQKPVSPIRKDFTDSMPMSVAPFDSQSNWLCHSQFLDSPQRAMNEIFIIRPQAADRGGRSTQLQVIPSRVELETAFPNRWL